LLNKCTQNFLIAIDDFLMEQVGIACHVYMDDIIIFSDTIEQLT